MANMNAVYFGVEYKDNLLLTYLRYTSIIMLWLLALLKTRMHDPCAFAHKVNAFLITLRDYYIKNNITFLRFEPRSRSMTLIIAFDTEKKLGVVFC